MGQQVTLRGERLRIKFAAVKEDSRCPSDVTCIWAGNAAVQLDVSISRRDSKLLTLNTGGTSSLPGEVLYRGYELRLLGLNPYPRSKQKIAPGDYTVTVLISKERAVVSAQDKPRVADIDRVRLAEAFSIGETVANQLWEGGRAPALLFQS